MLSKVRRFFDDFMVAGAAGPDPERAAQCAAAALLLEMAHMDEALAADEREAVLAAVREQFGLSAEQAVELLDCAEAERAEATDYFQFTSLINRQFDAAQRADLVERLWRVAYADQRLCRHEEYLARKVANLLHVPHAVCMAARRRVQTPGRAAP